MITALARDQSTWTYSYIYGSRGSQIFLKNLATTSKFSVPQDWHETNSIQMLHKREAPTNKI